MPPYHSVLFLHLPEKKPVKHVRQVSWLIARRIRPRLRLLKLALNGDRTRIAKHSNGCCAGF